LYRKPETWINPRSAEEQYVVRGLGLVCVIFTVKYGRNFVKPGAKARL